MSRPPLPSVARGRRRGPPLPAGAAATTGMALAVLACMWNLRDHAPSPPAPARPAPVAASPEVPPVLAPEETFVVVLTNPVSRDSRPDDPFTARLLADLGVGSQGPPAYPAGSLLAGRVLAVARTAGRDMPMAVQLLFERIETPEGLAMTIRGRGVAATLPEAGAAAALGRVGATPPSSFEVPLPVRREAATATAPGAEGVAADGGLAPRNPAWGTGLSGATRTAPAPPALPPPPRPRKADGVRRGTVLSPEDAAVLFPEEAPPGTFAVSLGTDPRTAVLPEGTTMVIRLEQALFPPRP